MLHQEESPEGLPSGLLAGVRPRDRHRLKGGIGLLRGLHLNVYIRLKVLSNKKFEKMDI